MSSRLPSPLLVLLLLSVGCAHLDAPPPPARYTGPVVDLHAHVHFGDGYGQTDASHPPGTEALLGLAAQAHVEKSGIIVMAPRGNLPATRALNDQVIAAARASHGRLFPIASVHPDDGAEALTEMERLRSRPPTRWRTASGSASPWPSSASSSTPTPSGCSAWSRSPRARPPESSGPWGSACPICWPVNVKQHLGTGRRRTPHSCTT